MSIRLKLIICGIMAVVFGVSGYMLYSIFRDYRAGEDSYNNLQQYAPPPADETPGDPEPSAKQPLAQFDELRAINPDVVGWIRLEACDIDYPIVQGSDNEYYLTHLVDGKYNSSGSIFMDYRNDPALSDRNTIIYGHHMQNNKMFAKLGNYDSQSFYDAHPTFQLFTPQANFEVEIFAGYVATVEDEAWLVQIRDEDLPGWLEARLRQSAFRSDVTVGPGDRIITLSTCSYEFKDARFVLFGVIHE